ncbi:MAG: recombination mediator RecR [bacterium]
MNYNYNSMEILINEISKMPGIGKKTARRLAFYLLKTPYKEINKLIDSIIIIKQKIKYCKICFHITEQEICNICQNPQRENSIICVVESSNDLMAIESSKGYNGVYHVLMGVISPLEGIDISDLKIDSLLQRVKEHKPKEIIIATNPDSEGEFTANYLLKILKPFDIKISRIARGIPIGGEIEYSDYATLSKSFQGRTEI